MNIAIYARCASWVQCAIDPLEDQIIACRNRAEILGKSVEPSLIYRDIGVSGASPINGCPGLKSLLKDAFRLPRRFDLVVVKDSARLGRSYTRVSEVYRALHGAGVRIVFANGEEFLGLGGLVAHSTCADFVRSCFAFHINFEGLEK